MTGRRLGVMSLELRGEGPRKLLAPNKALVRLRRYTGTWNHRQDFSRCEAKANIEDEYRAGKTDGGWTGADDCGSGPATIGTVRGVTM